MSPTPPNLHFHDLRPPTEDFRSAVIEGLSSRPRVLAPKFFYDARGSRLFDAITELPEYYPTRTEIALLRNHGPEIAELLGEGLALIELGSGSEVKIQALLEALRPSVYMPIDISGEHLHASAAALAARQPTLEVHALCADYTRPFTLPDAVQALPRAAFYPGSSIGNFDPDEATTLLRRTAGWLGKGGCLLIGVDLKKDTAVLNAAYDDSQGVTARFNLNLLSRIRDELGAKIDPWGFRHEAFYNTAAGRIEMHLIATRAQTVVVDGHVFEFATGDGIHTENSWKYTIDEFGELATRAGFDTLRVWTDPDQLFSVHCLAVGNR